MRALQNKFFPGIFFIALLAMTVLFQNCSGSKFGQASIPESKASGSGGSNGGFDGKPHRTFVHVGSSCDLDSPPNNFDTIIDISLDLTIAYLTRKNCQDLAPPYVNIAGDLNTDGLDLAVLVHKSDNMLLDIPSGNSHQRVTSIFCENLDVKDSVSLAVWGYSNNSNQLFTDFLGLPSTTGPFANPSLVNTLSSQIYTNPLGTTVIYAQQPSGGPMYNLGIDGTETGTLTDTYSQQIISSSLVCIKDLLLK